MLSMSAQQNLGIPIYRNLPEAASEYPEESDCRKILGTWKAPEDSRLCSELGCEAGFGDFSAAPSSFGKSSQELQFWLP